MTAPLGYVTLTTSAPSLSVQARLDEAVPQLTGGGGGWVEVQRPGKSSLVEWQGGTAEKLVLSIYFDGWIARTSVQRQVDDLQSMSIRHKGSAQPPIVSVDGHVRGAGTAWVIQDDIQWGDELRDETSGELLRKAAVVNLIASEPGTVAVAARQPGTPPFFARHTAAKGDTLQTISMLYYGVTTQWRTIGQAQKPVIRDPRVKIKIGRVILVPL